MTAETAIEAAALSQPESLRGRLPVVDQEQAAIARALLARGDTLDSDVDGRHLVLRCGAPPQPAPTNAVQLAHADGHALYAQTLARNEPTLGDLAWQDLAGEARMLAWSLSHEALLSSLSDALGQPLSPDALLHGAVAPDRWHWLTLAFDHADGDLHCEGWLALDAAAARALAVNPGWHFDAEAAAARRARTVLACELLAPAPRVDLATLRGIAAGDVLMLGTRSIGLASLRLVVPSDAAQPAVSVTWGAKWADGALTLTQRFAMDADMAEEGSDDDTAQAAGTPDDAAPAIATSPLDALPAHVEVVLATPRMSLGEVEHLSPGQVVPLRESLDHAAVRLRVNGAAFARGELVALGDTLGVRIVSIDDSG